AVGSIIRFVVRVAEADQVVFRRSDVFMSGEQKVVKRSGGRSTQDVGLSWPDGGAERKIEALANVNHRPLAAVFERDKPECFLLDDRAPKRTAVLFAVERGFRHRRSRQWIDACEGERQRL